MYKLLSHNDLDGVGCGLLAKLAFGDSVDVRYNSIGSLDREVKYFLENHDGEIELIITDMSVNEENEKKLQAFHSTGGNVQLIDHHKSALHFNEYDWGHVVVEDEKGKQTSATSLLYEYLINNELLGATKVISAFVELVRQYDTWEWEKNNNLQAKRLNTLFFLLSIDEFAEKMINRLKSSDHFYFDDFEEKILEMEEAKIERYIRRKRRELVQSEIEGKFAGIVYAESYHSELGNELGKEYPHLDYIAILNMGGKRLGFRTIHDHVDVSEIAGTYGGGGHEKASGATLTDDAYKRFIANTFKLDPLKEDAKRNKFNVKDTSFGSMYKDRSGDLYMIYQENGEWKIDKNKVRFEQSFSSFEEAETYLKRKYAAWLEKDELFVQYLMEQVKQKN
ncbi:oligoribonuclease [Aquibacillus koreensis]|uniref:Oligoribonuclease n=1 Tax=Aquibacillus koreensis TaxID=279446 RepID=A0A9X3WSZ4_9BACI|nr:oligoribonuclease [Aquibacillus koreensis]MCT2535247.1 oligoribonuclease [Aquibacillus koreensis]MDC3422794.1 oligoribonuclease [Aquibacillus koreensis]